MIVNAFVMKPLQIESVVGTVAKLRYAGDGGGSSTIATIARQPRREDLWPSDRVSSSFAILPALMKVGLRSQISADNGYAVVMW
jgi:hypothetical protein